MFNSSVLNNKLLVAAAVLAVLVVLLITALLVRRRGPKLDVQKFQTRWQNVQKLCAKSETWPLAIIDADKLLDEVLRKCRCKGRTMGERLVSAQRMLSDNDGVWFGHKLRNKIVHEEMPKLNRRDVESALRGLRQAMQDLGALK